MIKIDAREVILMRPHIKYERSFRVAFTELQSESDRLAWIYLGEEEYSDFFKISFLEYVNSRLPQKIGLTEEL